MASDLNKVILVGRLTRDPDYRIINQNPVVNFSIANNRTYVTGGDKREETHFFECEAWGKLADIIKQYAKKGQQVAIDGRLRQSTWETPEGKKNSKIRIVVENLQLLGGGIPMDREESSKTTDDYPDQAEDIPHEAEDTVF